MELKQAQNIYFIGIGGIGMSALARWFLRNGALVAGYDRAPSALSQELEAEGMQIHYEDNLALVPQAIKDNPEVSLIVYTPAIPAAHTELSFFRGKAEFTLLKRSQVLGLIADGHQSICVAGTHGKTTTSSMVAHILHYLGKPTTAFLGGITQNYQTNLLLSEAPVSETLLVAEADEFDRSFLTLHPDTAIITSVDADHLDIYQEHSFLLDSFSQFISQIHEGGTLIIKEGLEFQYSLPAGVNLITYGTDQANLQAQNLRVEGTRFVFEAALNGTILTTVALAMPGHHNVENALASMLAAMQYDLTPDAIAEALYDFKGVRRRFEYQLQEPNLVYIDDYAHHPTEIEAFLKSLRTLYPGRKIKAIFQPHLFTRTRDFAEGFSAALSIADEVLLLPIYPAREQPIAGVNSEMLMAQITKPTKMVTKENLLDEIEVAQGDVWATIGAGDIDAFVKPLKNAFFEHSKLL